MSVNPQPVAPKSGGFQTEVSTQTSFSDLFRFFAPIKLKVSKNSPPLTVDVNELELVIDKTAKRLYTKIDGSLRYIAWT